jgi:hypothetical protein
VNFGPFAVSSASIEGLGGTGFTQFVNRLLATEAAARGLAGTSLMVTHRDNLADGGVDAQLRTSLPTRWLPLGDSAWQFKAGDLPPAACKVELRGAEWAVQVLKSGGKYRLVLGRSMTAKKISDRRTALRDMAGELGINLEEDAIEVLTWR